MAMFLLFFLNIFIGLLMLLIAHSLQLSGCVAAVLMG